MTASAGIEAREQISAALQAHDQVWYLVRHLWDEPMGVMGQPSAHIEQEKHFITHHHQSLHQCQSTNLAHNSTSVAL